MIYIKTSYLNNNSITTIRKQLAYYIISTGY